MRAHRSLLILLVALAEVATPAGGSSPAPSNTQVSALASLARTAGPAIQIHVEQATGVPSFVRAPAGELLARDDASREPEQRARSFLAAYGAAIGIDHPAAVDATLQLREVATDPAGNHHVKLDQVHGGIPVFGARVVVHLNEHGVTAVNGHYVPAVDLATTPLVDARAARAHAAAGMANAVAGTTSLQVFRRGLVEGARGDTRLAWAVEVAEGAARDQVWIDALDGRALARYPLTHAARDRCVYTPRYDPENPELFVVRREGDPSLLVTPIDRLYDFSGQVYDLFFHTFGFDSYDDGHLAEAAGGDRTGAKMRTVYLVNENCPNAYWDGASTNYCPGFDVDDVVAHEWAHAYTDFTHDLVYAYQPGALNEAYSDIWGETLDLLNDSDGAGGFNNDEPYPAGVRWLVGEDVTLHDRVHRLIGLRDMWDPERLGFPGRVRGNGFVCGTGDEGGVHTNSSVANHAYAMLVDGKTYREHTVQPIGMTKAAHIYWQAQRYYQTPASKFTDHDGALRASCVDLQGLDLAALMTGGPSGEAITEHDCAQVATAMVATEMAESLRCVYHPILRPDAPPVCDGAEILFTEDFENGLDGWELASEGERAAWPGWQWEAAGDLPGGRAGRAAFAIDARAGSCDSYVIDDVSGRFSMTGPAQIAPADTGGLLVRFDHYVETQRGFDGGNVMISVDGGEFGVVPQQAFVHSPPLERLNGQVAGTAINGNPKAGEYAWHGTDGGEVTGSWGTSVIDLDRLVDPGQTYLLRWEFGVDRCAGRTGWFVDDVAIYRCVATTEE